jgi:hypothetical protein
MKNQNEVVKAIYKCLKPGGRFTGEMGGYGNIKSKSYIFIYIIVKKN